MADIKVVTIDVADFMQVIDQFGYWPGHDKAMDLYSKCFKNPSNITDDEIRKAAATIKGLSKTTKHIATIIDRLFTVRYTYYNLKLIGGTN